MTDHKSTPPPLRVAEQAVRAPQARPAPVLARPPAITPPQATKPLVNWRIVAAVGGIAWVWMVGVIMIGWLASRSTAVEPAQAAAATAAVAAPGPATPAPQPGPVVVPVLQPYVFVGPPLPRPEDEAKVEAPKPEPVVQAPPPPRVKEEPAGKCGTSVDFMEDPIEAGHKAMQDHKIMFVLHVSGDFEDPGFT
ncbi:MAG: hypothetical protein K2R98_23470 [Gemmataceae bacterium]|nr:hypothetical protein [Gemmataceae bacterium]